ncbi:MAG: YihY/virulence factor BrkB family protein [Cyanobacteria bacterium J069]|nr:MAG: YihY/virulence factor BrkB family protein [Cyanobacteria bacterium J069]
MLTFPRFLRFFAHLRPAVVRRVAHRAAEHRLPGLSAEMAYNAMLALFPAILAILTAIGLFQPLNNTFLRIMQDVSEVVPNEAWGIIQSFTEELSNSRDRTLFSLSFLIAVWAASGAASAAMTALDQIHQIPRSKLRPFWKAKLVSLGLTVGGLLLLIVALTVVFVGDLIVRQVSIQAPTLRPWLLTLWQLLPLPVTLLIISITFGAIYRFGPSRWDKGRPIMPGALLAAIFWAVLSNLFRLYVSNFADYNRVYGAVGAVIILLLWLYLTSLVMLLGDEVNVTVGEAIERYDHLRQLHFEEIQQRAEARE